MIPIGSSLMIDGEIVGRGHNCRVQNGSAILHGRPTVSRTPGALRRRLPTSHALHDPVAVRHVHGAALLYGIPRIVIGENETFMGAEASTESRGVELVRANDPQCVEMMTEFIAAEPELWNEDIGE